jgi:PAS domain S-box-containing protein
MADPPIIQFERERIMADWVRARKTGAGLTAQETRKFSEQSYRDLISTINGIIWEADSRMDVLTYVSDSAERILGYTSAEWMAQPQFWERHLHPNDAQKAIACYQVSTEAGHSYESTYRMIARSGAVVWIHEAVSTVVKNGQVAFMRGVMVDVTKLKTAKRTAEANAARLAESEKRLSAILDTAAIGIVTLNEDLRISSFNLEAERIFGYEAEEMFGRTVDLLMPAPFTGAYHDRMMELSAGSAQSHSTGEWRSIDGRAADGRIIPLATIISKVTVLGKTSVTIIMRDMTALQKSENEMRHLLIERELAVARGVAENSAKSSFLAIMSHELRTPLNAIIGFSELMSRETMGPIGSDTYKGYITDIYQSGELLLTIINGILDLSRIESGKRELHIKDLSLEEVWHEIAGTLVFTAKAKGVTLCATPNSSRKFTADRDAISQILLNLVSNAIKFTPMGGTIEVGQEDNSPSGEIVLYVRDNGRGIPADQLSDVMKPFTQVSNSHVRDAGGVGLGLTICHSLAVKMSGRIEIQSQLGGGTTVRVFLPSNAVSATRLSA